MQSNQIIAGYRGVERVYRGGKKKKSVMIKETSE